MPRIHVLTAGFETPNGRAFLFPLVVWRRDLREAGLDVRFFHRSSAEVTDCDVLIVDSKFHRDRWATDLEAVLAEFSALSEKCRLVYCDTTDSSGSLQAEVLPIVHVYGKAQVLTDRRQYMRPIYGHRLHADYYHRHFAVADAAPEWSVPAERESDLGKIRVSWNSGLADYSFAGPARMALFDWVSLPLLLRFPPCLAEAGRIRTQDVSCRFGTTYARASVAYQRKEIRRIARDRFDTRKLSRRQYFGELQNSKVVVSPFGYGEITLKDFEVFLTGGLLIKPDMSHMQTWPDMFRAGETMLTHGWDLKDFEAVVDGAIQDRSRQRIAEAAQSLYQAHLRGPDAAGRFIAHLKELIN